MSSTPTTIVSAFLTDINRRDDRDTEKYIEYGKRLLTAISKQPATLNAIIFIEPHMYHHYAQDSHPIKTHEYITQPEGIRHTFQYIQNLANYPNIIFVFFEKTDLFLWPFRELSKYNFHQVAGNPAKDTIEYMCVQCQKTEWLNIAISFSSMNQDKSYYIWVDFGIYHMFLRNPSITNPEQIFQQEFAKIAQTATALPINQVRFASCWDPNHYYARDIYRDIYWVFAGSALGGHANILRQFAYWMREKCFQIMRERNLLIWEVNIWYLIYREHPEAFSPYKSDHTEIILSGFSIQ